MGIHLGHSVAPEQLILEEEADLREGGEGGSARGAPAPRAPSPPKPGPSHSRAVPRAGPGRCGSDRGPELHSREAPFPGKA